MIRHIDAPLKTFFPLRQSVFSDRRLYTQYPPGQAALAVFTALGLRWWSGAVLSTIGIIFTYLLAATCTRSSLAERERMVGC